MQLLKGCGGSMFLRYVSAVLALVILTGCTSTSGTSVDDLFSDVMRETDSSGRPVRYSKANSRLLAANNDASNGVDGVYREGTGTYVSSRAPSVGRGTTASGTEGYTLNLVGAPISAAAKNVLGDILKVNYTIDPRVQGTVSLQTSEPVDKATLVDLFESSLAVSGASVVRRGSAYQIVPTNEALGTTPAVSVPSMAQSGPGISVQVIELANIGADEMRTILEPIVRPGSIIRTDSARNNIVVSGTAQDLAAIRDAISVFDVDAMRGRSVAMLPLKNSKPSSMAAELDQVFANGKDGNGIVRFIPNERLNSILVISSRPAYLQRAASWVRKLDQNANTNEEQLFVYEIQNRPAKELAGVLQSVLQQRNNGGNESSSVALQNPVAPDLTPASLQNNADLSQPAEPVEASSATQQEQYSPPNEAGPKAPSVVADVENNALLISTTPKEYKRIERILHQLDVLPTQVMLEAIIAEVKLNDELKFGLRWAVESGKFKFNLSDVASGFAGGSLPGAAWSFVSSDLQVTLNALSSLTDVKIISSPNIMALNNQRATLQVGDQVPIVTQQASGVVTANAPVVNSITLKDTGIILSVLPRINAAGRVLLAIDQEVSSVVKTTTSGIDSPTIQQRKLSTKVIVNDGESIALGGLIQETNSLDRGQVPIVGDVPILGNLFKNKTDKIVRTELIIFIRPRVIRDINEARDVTDEFRNKLHFDTALTQRRKGKTVLQRDINRLAY